MHIRYLLFLIYLMPLLASGQDFRARMEALKAEYARLSNVHIEMEIKVFASEETEPLFVQNAIIKRQGELYYYRMGATEMVMNKKYILMVDESARQIVCTARSLKAEKAFDDPLTVNFDSLLLFYETPQLLNSEPNTERYKLSPKGGEILEATISIDLKQNIVTQIDYLYRVGHRAIIWFNKFDKDVIFTEADFSESRFVLEEKGHLKTTPLYSRFNLAVN